MRPCRVARRGAVGRVLVKGAVEVPDRSELQFRRRRLAIEERAENEGILVFREALQREMMRPVRHVDERRVAGRRVGIIYAVERGVESADITLDGRALRGRDVPSAGRLEVEKRVVEIRLIVARRREPGAAAGTLVAARIVIGRLHDAVGVEMLEVHAVRRALRLLDEQVKPERIRHRDVAAAGVQEDLDEPCAGRVVAGLAREFVGDRIVDQDVVELRRVRRVECPVIVRGHPEQRQVAALFIELAPRLERVGFSRKAE